MSEKEENWQDENTMKARAEAASAAETVGTIEFAGENARKPSLIYLALKRVFDILASGIGLILLSWLFFIIAIIIAVSEGFPVIHKRKCIGKDRKPFYMYKFRSMVLDSDNLEKYMTPEQIKEYKELCKLDDDPRITKIGKFLRKTSLDELPQLLNVFLGDMSLIGPRPVVQSEADEYGTDLDTLLSVRPGITGYWQVYGRGDKGYISIESKQQQLYYPVHCGILLDIKILLRTVYVVLSGKGAK
ncbi:MAG: sugar transferase [Clostridiales bacterium]|nr:sugar transferase [Clostridiales bacterium]